MNAFDIIKNQQISWAQKHKIPLDKNGYVQCLEHNLFEPLCREAEGEFNRANGKELEGDKAKMKAIYSSSGLVCNFFHYWRFNGGVKIITNALGVVPGYESLKFEKTYKKPKEIRGIRPHLDVEITGKSLPVIAIESKFSEPYHSSFKKLKPIYGEKACVWAPFARCKELASKIIKGEEKFKRFDAPQLLKHILGIKTDIGGNFKLYYLWYKINIAEAKEHEQEIKRFMSLIDKKINFYAITYQELFDQIESFAGSSHRNYINYMKERYFADMQIC